MTRSQFISTASTLLIGIAAGAMLAMPSACAQNPSPDQSMQNADQGMEQVDQGMDNAEQGMDKTKREADRGMKKAGEDMQKESQDADHDMKAMGMNHNQVERAIAVLRPTQGNDARGTVHLTQQDGKVQITATVRNLKPGSVHAIHIHEYGDVSAEDGKATGGHYNPEHVKHALPKKDKRHAGDLGNLQKANSQGVAKKKITVSNISLDDENHPVLGRAVIVHAKKDDGGQPTGNADGRIAQGVIGIDQAK